MDDWGNHILVDDAYNITGIIDWEWAQTVPMSEAFAAPLFMLDVGQYYEGNNALGEIEELFATILKGKDQTGLANFVGEGRTQHRLAHCIGGDPADPEFYNLFTALLQLTQGSEVGKEAWDVWRAETMTLYGDDSEFQRLQKP